MTSKSVWIEIWIDSSSKEYLLALRQLESGEVAVLDPQAGWTVVQTFGKYEEAADWLNEDEYDLVEGRTFQNDV